MAVYQRPCKRRECQEKKSCKHAHWCYDFCINNVRYFGAIKEARTRPQAEQAEIRIKNDVFEGIYGSHKKVAPAFNEAAVEVIQRLRPVKNPAEAEKPELRLAVNN